MSPVGCNMWQARHWTRFSRKITMHIQLVSGTVASLAAALYERAAAALQGFGCAHPHCHHMLGESGLTESMVGLYM